MIWTPFFKLKLANEWRFTPIVDGAYFRLRHLSPPKAPIGWLAQAEVIEDGSLQLFGIERLNGLVPSEVVVLQSPPCFRNRRIGFRQEAKVINDWNIEVEYCDMPLFNPATVSPAVAHNVAITSTQVSTKSIVLLPANLNRMGATFTNITKLAVLYLKAKDEASTSSYLVKINPGGYFELPIVYTGDITGIWDKPELNASCVIHEFS